MIQNELEHLYLACHFFRYEKFIALFCDLSQNLSDTF